VWRTNAYSVECAADGTTCVDIRVDPGDHAWYVLPKGDPQRVRELAAAGCWVGAVDVELEGSVQLELWFRIADDWALKENVVRNHMTLGPGRNWVRLFVPHRPAFLYPAFRVTGQGRFCVTSFSLTCRD
jgi:hypothetical protein